MSQLVGSCDKRIVYVVAKLYADGKHVKLLQDLIFFRAAIVSRIMNLPDKWVCFGPWFHVGYIHPCTGNQGKL